MNQFMVYSQTPSSFLSVQINRAWAAQSLVTFCVDQLCFQRRKCKQTLIGVHRPIAPHIYYTLTKSQCFTNCFTLTILTRANLPVLISFIKCIYWRPCNKLKFSYSTSEDLLPCSRPCDPPVWRVLRFSASAFWAWGFLLPRTETSRCWPPGRRAASSPSYPVRSNTAPLQARRNNYNQPFTSSKYQESRLQCTIYLLWCQCLSL